jgi:hypothetical protein
MNLTHQTRASWERRDHGAAEGEQLREDADRVVEPGCGVDAAEGGDAPTAAEALGDLNTVVVSFIASAGAEAGGVEARGQDQANGHVSSGQ